MNHDLSAHPPHANTAATRLFNGLLIALAVVFAVLAIRYQYFLLRHIEWGDESETVVTVKMMAAGQKLYSEIFNHHGPLTFLTGVVLEHFGDFGMRGHRVPVALLHLAGLLSIYFCPLFASRAVKLGCVVFAASVMLFYLPELLGHTYTYQALTGTLLLIILFIYTFPALLEPERVTAARSFTGSALIAGLPFLAVTYIPLALILFAVSARPQSLRPALAGLLAGLAVNLLFLAAYGSIPGYLAYHLYLNLTILPGYINEAGADVLILKAVHSATKDIAQFTYLTITAGGIAILASKERTLPWRSVLLGMAVASLLIRGSDFRGLPYYYALIAFMLLPTLRLRAIATQGKIIGVFFISVCIAKSSLLLPGERYYFRERRIPTETEFSRLVQQHTDKEDRIIAYTFQNFQYLASDRLPASGHFFYFPWQEKYNDDPKYGIRIDACAQIAAHRPKVMLIDKWNVWDRFPWESYAGCIQSIIDANYIQVPGRPYYVRSDIYLSERSPAAPADRMQ